MHNIASKSDIQSQEETAVCRSSLPHKSKRALINCGLLPTSPSDLTAIRRPVRRTLDVSPTDVSCDSDDSLLNELVEIMQEKAKVVPVRKGRRVVLKARTAIQSPNMSCEGKTGGRKTRWALSPK